MNFIRELRLFTIKVLIVAGILSTFFSVAAVVANAAARSLLAQFSYPPSLVTVTAGKIELMNPSSRAALHQSLASLATQLRPFLDDLRPLFGGSDTCAPKTNASP